MTQVDNARNIVAASTTAPLRKNLPIKYAFSTPADKRRAMKQSMVELSRK
jgi:hypothetical protein